MPKLVITEGPDAGRSFPLTGEEIIVGRGDAAAIQVSDLTVSREHFSLVPEGTGWKLLDRGSRNRTLVNGDPVLVHFLRDGDRVAVGSTLFAYVGEVSASTPVPNALDLLPTGFENVTLELRGLADIARGAGRLAALYTFTEEVSRADRLDELYPCITRLARAKCDADRAFLFVVDRSGELMTAARSSEDAAERVSVSRTVIDKVLQEGTSIVAADALGDLRLQGKASIVENAIRSVMCAPIVSRGRTIGIVYVDIQRDGRHFEHEDLRFLSAIGQQAGIAIDNLILRDALMAENHALRSQVTQRHNLVGDSPAIGAVLTFIGKVARTDSTVMLNGESGTGKELVARAIHAASPRANKPFVAVNCAALTESLLESELFGHEKGAFTGATAQAKGRFELADTGTLFLDEVGELSPNVQTKFLRVLEESCFQRVGGARQIHVDVRVIAATNRDLPTMVSDGSFRADLFYRLQVIQIELPPVRRRTGDVPLLVQHFVQRYASKMGRRIEGVAPDAMDAMCAYPWPGNVRELKNAIERAMVLGEGPVLRLEDLPPSISAGGGDVTEALGDVGVRTIKEMEREAIVAALRETQGNKARAAQLLEIDRSTLYKKIKDYEIDV